MRFSITPPLPPRISIGAQVSRISCRRGLPGPPIRIPGDITNTPIELHAGPHVRFHGSGKREAMGREAAMASGVARRATFPRCTNCG